MRARVVVLRPFLTLDYISPCLSTKSVARLKENSVKKNYVSATRETPTRTTDFVEKEGLLVFCPHLDNTANPKRSSQLRTLLNQKLKIGPKKNSGLYGI